MIVGATMLNTPPQENKGPCVKSTGSDKKFQVTVQIMAMLLIAESHCSRQRREFQCHKL